MILNEQTYKNLNRPYYIGRIKGYDRSKADFGKFFYLTTDLLYAIFYANKDGYVEEYRLRNNINIFNARSQKDYNTLRLALLADKDLNVFTKFLDDLKTEDWTFILGNYDKRDRIVDLLIHLGYDGYFNYEYTAKLKKELEKKHIVPPVFESEPAIGVLNISNFKKVQEIDYEHLMLTTAYSKLKDMEKDNAESECSYYLFENSLPRDVVKSILYNKSYITLGRSDTDKIVNDFHVTESDNAYAKFIMENTNARYIWRRD